MDKKNDKKIVKSSQTPTSLKPENNSNKEIIPTSTTDFIETQNEDLIMVDRTEYEILKKRYRIAKSCLEAVLCFIVPMALRDLVNKTMKEIAEQ
jgi:hypothetical protein